MTNVTFDIVNQCLMIPMILISILATNQIYILHTMLENIQEHMRALIAQRGSVSATLVAFR
jgi:hypothetical protein